MKRQLKRSIPSNRKTCITCDGTKLSAQFLVKERTKFERKQNVVYFSGGPNVTCNDRYVGQTDRRIRKRIIDDNKRNKVHIY